MISESSSDTKRIGILRDLGTLLTHNIFSMEMQRQVKPLPNVSPSLVDFDVAEQPNAAN